MSTPFFHFFSFSFQTLDFSAFSPIPPPLSPLFLLYNAAKSPKAKPQWHAIRVLNCRQIYFNAAERFGKPRVSRVKSAVGIYFRRGKQRVSRLFSRWNSSVYSSVSTSRNPDFDLGVDFVDTLNRRQGRRSACYRCFFLSYHSKKRLTRESRPLSVYFSEKQIKIFYGTDKSFFGKHTGKQLKVEEKPDIMWELAFYQYKRRVSFGFY